MAAIGLFPEALNFAVSELAGSVANDPSVGRKFAQVSTS